MYSLLAATLKLVKPSLLPGLQHCGHIRGFPKSIGHASDHRRRSLERLMDTDEDGVLISRFLAIRPARRLAAPT